ncbi:4223_t:CDS:2, partial [Funneliformis geosporum]
IAIFVTFAYSSPFPQGTGEPKDIKIEGPGPGPLTVGSKATVTWKATGFDADEPISFGIFAEHNTEPPFFAETTLFAGSITFPIDDKFIPGTKYGSVIVLKSDKTLAYRGQILKVTAANSNNAMAVKANANISETPRK